MDGVNFPIDGTLTDKYVFMSLGLGKLSFSNFCLLEPLTEFQILHQNYVHKSISCTFLLKTFVTQSIFNVSTLI